MSENTEKQKDGKQGIDLHMVPVCWKCGDRLLPIAFKTTIKWDCAHCRRMSAVVQSSYAVRVVVV